MKIERFKFGKGISSKKDGVWKKEYIELEIKLPDTATDKDFQDEFTAAEYIIDNLLIGVPGTEKPAGPTAKASNNAMLLMTFDEVEAQQWIASKWVRAMDPDRKAKLGEDAYMQTLAADKRLIKMINDSPNRKLELPPYAEITYAGDGGLIVRKAKAKEKKKT